MPVNREQKSSGADAGRDDVRADETQNRAGETGASSEFHGEAHGADLDLEGLDLTVETVEERISPSETNVFDK